MANAKFPEFVRSTEYRRELGLKRKRAIQKMYSDIAKETEKKIQDIERAGKWSGTTVLQMKQLRDLQKSVNESLKTVTAQIEKDISSDIRKVAEVTCADVAGFMQRSGVRTVVSLAHVPETAVKNIISGNIYGQRWNFSEAIWGDYKKSTDDLAAIVSKGLAAQKPIYDIAKDLEKYVNPAVRKDYDWSRIYPGTKKKSDYNAARLAITMSTHAHQQAVILSCKEDPLIDGVEWRTSGGSNVCPLCEQRNGEVFPLDKCPMDHPMGVCVLIPHYKGMKTDKETGRTTNGDDFYERNSEVDEERLRSEFEKEKERLRAEREAKNAAARAAQEKANQNAADLLERAQKSAEELDKAVREVQEKVKALQEAAKKQLTSSGNGGIVINDGKIHILGSVDRSIRTVDDLLSGSSAELEAISDLANKYYGTVKIKTEFSYAVNEYTKYNGLPLSVSEIDFSLLAVSHSPIYRGLSSSAIKSAADMAEDFKNGSVYFGKRSYGSGFYFNPDIAVAKSYSKNDGMIISAILADDAKYITFREINKISMDIVNSKKYYGSKLLNIISNNSIDVGRLASLLGYDAIIMDGFNGQHHIIVLNRTKLIVKG